MSHSGSGASTPRSGGVTPTPPSGEGHHHPQPLKVGINFVRQYYKVLSETPDQIFRFYQPTSFLSEGVGAQKTQPVTFEEKQEEDGRTEQLKDRFYLPHQEEEGGEERCPIRFEFENGAIDAQLSVNGGVLLVVTGQVVYLNVVADEDADEEEEEKFRKAFVHTFFLASIMAGNKRSYYVHNDVLRFLDDSIMKQVEEAVSKEEEEVAAPDSNSKLVVGKETKVDAVEPALMEEEPKVVEKVEEVVKKAATEKADAKPVAAAVVMNHGVDNEAPGNGVEETKEELLIEEMTPAVEEKTAHVESSESSKPVGPGSWASLVARSGAGSTSSAPTSPAGTPARPIKAAAASSSAKPKTSPVTATATATTTKAAPTAAESAPASSKPRQGRRDPECTLVIKNVADGVTDADVLGLFEPFAVKTGTKIANHTVSTNRAIAFVDYDSPAPVLAAIEQGQKEPFRLKDRVLEIYQKTVEQRARRSSGSGGRSGQRGGANGSSSFRGGGRQQHRRGAGGRSGGRSGGGTGTGGR